MASILELFFVLGQIKKVANSPEAGDKVEAPSWIGIAITYFLATAISAGLLTYMIIYVSTYDKNHERYLDE